MYEIVSHASSSAANDSNLELEVSGSFTQETHKSIIGTDGTWGKFRDDFYTSGSSTGTQNLKLTFTAVSCSNASTGPLLDSIFLRSSYGISSLLVPHLPQLGHRTCFVLHIHTFQAIVLL